MICPECLAVFLEKLPEIVGYAISQVPAIGPFFGPFVEAMARSLIRLSRGDDMGTAARAEMPDHEAVVRRLLVELQAEEKKP